MAWFLPLLWPEPTAPAAPIVCPRIVTAPLPFARATTEPLGAAVACASLPQRVATIPQTPRVDVRPVC